ncbi:hypothetical protein GCM10017691_27480 [Pseudonocardia petroleophila]|uniref:RNA-binding S4 domain-containing protein n=1 Tax=Pseudonocardia petroleophila TaxID=37331 RepID=A0A7G7MEZ9_9PSEU|nr:hypothetical protein [Pseudonocardia petroleophila]QNG51360.1 hypothetical protein H6H00_24960 [Pseudonocardia petroleophila]
MDTSRSSTALAERTVLDRLIQSGIAPDRAIEHIMGGWVLVDGEQVRDPQASAEPPAKVELRSIPRR